MAQSPAPPLLPAASSSPAAQSPITASEVSDEALVAAVLAGDQAAFGQLMERWRRPVYRTVWRIVGQAEDAEDLTQEAFLRAYAALDHFDPSYRFGAWITRIAANVSLNFRRHRARESVVGATSDDADAFFEHRTDGAELPETVVDDDDVAARLWAAVEALPEDYRTAILMRHVSEMSYEDMAATLGVPMGTVKSRLARARRALGELMGE